MKRATPVKAGREVKGDASGAKGVIMLCLYQKCMEWINQGRIATDGNFLRDATISNGKDRIGNAVYSVHN